MLQLVICVNYIVIYVKTFKKGFLQFAIIIIIIMYCKKISYGAAEEECIAGHLGLLHNLQGQLLYITV